jgi:GrpB-like predicted nucleotidyltransferase (UPF0157 family)
MLVNVFEYDTAWPEQFQTIRSDLERILKDVPYSAIEHVGSTSVPGLSAKPVIDIDIIVSRDHLHEVIDALSEEGSYLFRGDLGIPDRYSFKFKDENALPKRNVYVCIHGCQSLRNHLAVRDLCRENAEVREKYGQAKRELSAREWESVDEYANAKTDILNWVLETAGFDMRELEEIAVMNGKPL